jgi:hypothetical protein
MPGVARDNIINELEKLIMALYENNYNYIKIIIICKGSPPRERAPVLTG